MATNNKAYLGDAVYARFEYDSGYLVLTTEDGISATNTIMLEVEVLQNLLDYIKTVVKFNNPGGE